MKIKTRYELAMEYHDDEDTDNDEKKYISVDELNSEVIMNILTKVFEKAECCQDDTLWYDTDTTLEEMIVIQFEKELQGERR